MYDLIFDRKTSDVTNNLLKGSYNASDLNRVEEWCRYLADELNTLGYSINITTKTNWTYSGETGTIRKKSDMTRIKNNILALMNGYHYISTIYSSVDNWNITKANRWEKILYEIYCMMSSMENYYVLSGVGYSGEPRLWQNRLIQTYEGYPKSYEAIPYCQSTGTQYINLDTYSCSDERIVIDFEFTALGQCYIYGNNYSTHLISVGLDANNKFAYQYKGTLTTTNTTAVIGTRYVLDLTLKNGTQTLKINGAVVGTSTIADTNRAYSSNKQGLFYKRSSSSSAQLPASIKLYSCRIYNFDVLYQDIVPCKNSNDVTCLWDKVYNKLYENAGTGEFLPSEDVGDALLTESNRPITTESGEYIDYESVPYTMLDWIEATGTQYIDTNVQLGGGFKVECKVRIMSLDTTYETIIGSHELTSPYQNNFVRFRKESGSTTTWGVGERTTTSFATSVNTDYTIEASTIKTGQYLKINGTNVISSTSTSVTPSSITPYIFARNNGSAPHFFAKIRLYYLKLYNSNNELVRDFIPVLDYYNVACLYDRVSETYFHNQGTEEFIPSQTTSTYRKANYIESSGTQYINTGIKANNNTKVDIILSNFPPDTSWKACFGARTSAGSSDEYVFYRTDQGLYRSDYGGNRVTFPSGTNLTNKTEVIKDGASTTINGTTITNTASTFSATYNMWLFGLNGAGTLTHPASYKLYSCKIYADGTTLSLDLIPVIRISDNTPCLYDLVSNTFYTNAGTGTFLYG